MPLEKYQFEEVLYKNFNLLKLNSLNLLPVQDMADIW